jgi:hypothetical protein
MKRTDVLDYCQSALDALIEEQTKQKTWNSDSLDSDDSIFTVNGTFEATYSSYEEDEGDFFETIDLSLELSLTYIDDRGVSQVFEVNETDLIY